MYLVLYTLEMLVRANDPCMLCFTHLLMSGSSKELSRGAP